jgi:hypothetical protein
VWKQFPGISRRMFLHLCLENVPFGRYLAPSSALTCVTDPPLHSFASTSEYFLLHTSCSFHCRPPLLLPAANREEVWLPEWLLLRASVCLEHLQARNACQSLANTTQSFAWNTDHKFHCQWDSHWNLSNSWFQHEQ